MKHLLLTTIAAVVLVGCGESIHISIYEAAQNGNIKVLKRHLVNGVNVNEKGPFNASPLHIAVHNDHKEAAELLISKGADINSKGGGESYTPLMVTASKRRNDIARMLISNGADINATAKDGASALSLASGLNNIKLVKLLVSNNADINCADQMGITPLHSASMRNHKDIVEFLVSNKADVNSKTKDGLHTPLFSASLKGFDEITKLLILNGAEVNLKDKRGNTPLDLAVDGDHTETADLLRKHGGKTGEELEGGEPVAEATQPEQPTAKAPDISIHDAANEGNIEAVKQHIADGADVNAKDKGGWTPLHVAAGWVGHKKITELLIDKGAEVNAQGQYMGAPLHYAAGEGHMEIVELLIDKGADVNAIDADGKTPLGWAIRYNNPETANLLRKHGGKTGEELKK